MEGVGSEDRDRGTSASSTVQKIWDLKGATNTKGPQSPWTCRLASTSHRMGGWMFDFKQVEQMGLVRNSKKNTRLAVRNKQLEHVLEFPGRSWWGPVDRRVIPEWHNQQIHYTLKQKLLTDGLGGSRGVQFVQLSTTSCRNFKYFLHL